MIVEKVSIKKRFAWGGLVKTVGLSIFVLSLTVPAFLIILGSIGNPVGTPVSPLPAGEVASALTPTPTVTFASSLNLAQNYLDKAYTLAKSTTQTDSDKKAIVDSLNQSLNFATSAINQNHSDPQGYLMRAQILTAISKIKPEALTQAQADLDMASRLSNGQSVNLPSAINPINLIPDERAATASNIVIAAPNDSTASAVATDSTSNTTRSTVVVPAGQTEVTVTRPEVKDSTYIYLIPSNRNATVSVKSKSAGSFVIDLVSPQSTDVSIDYWLINQ